MGIWWAIWCISKQNEQSKLRSTTNSPVKYKIKVVVWEYFEKWEVKILRNTKQISGREQQIEGKDSCIIYKQNKIDGRNEHEIKEIKP